MAIPSTRFMSREVYEEFHEREWDPEIENEVEEEIDLEDCPICKWDEVCKGGCEVGVDCGYRFERAEEKE